jgi:hypothetical protein
MRNYRKLAEECVRAALKTKQPHQRRELLDLASEWLELAAHDAKTAMLWAEVDAMRRPAN